MHCERLQTSMSEAGCIARQKKSRARRNMVGMSSGMVSDPGCINCEQGLKISGLPKLETSYFCPICGQHKPRNEFRFYSAYRTNKACRACLQGIYRKQEKNRREAENHVYLVS